MGRCSQGLGRRVCEREVEGFWSTLLWNNIHTTSSASRSTGRMRRPHGQPTIAPCLIRKGVGVATSQLGERSGG